jgi:hypothetical protein
MASITCVGATAAQAPAGHRKTLRKAVMMTVRSAMGFEWILFTGE